MLDTSNAQSPLQKIGIDGIITQYKYIIKIFVEKKTTGNKHQLLPMHSHRYM
jgi:hypothetical protein